jgi:hypothetical protein
MTNNKKIRKGVSGLPIWAGYLMVAVICIGSTLLLVSNKIERQAASKSAVASMANEKGNGYVDQTATGEGSGVVGGNGADVGTGTGSTGSGTGNGNTDNGTNAGRTNARRSQHTSSVGSVTQHSAGSHEYQHVAPTIPAASAPARIPVALATARTSAVSAPARIPAAAAAEPEQAAVDISSRTTGIWIYG